MEVELSHAAGAPEQAAESACAELAAAIGRLTGELAACAPSAQARALVAAIQGHMGSLRARIGELEEFAEEQDRLEDTERLLLAASQRKREYERLQAELRKANLQVRRNAEQAAADERRALLGSPNPLERARRLESEADLAGAAQDITASLQRTRQQMAQELEHTSATLAAMDVSEDTLKSAKDEFAGQRATHRRSAQLLGTMRRHSWLDWLTLWGGLTLFLAVVAYIVGKRSLHFVPAFAKELALAPFRPRNATKAAQPAADPRLQQQQQQQQQQPTGSEEWRPPPELAELEAELEAATAGWEAGREQEQAAAADLTHSPDAEAGLTEADLQRRSEAEVRRAEQAAAAAEQQLAAAHPGSAWGDGSSGGVASMQAQTAPSFNSSAAGAGATDALNESESDQGAAAEAPSSAVEQAAADEQPGAGTPEAAAEAAAESAAAEAAADPSEEQLAAEPPGSSLAQEQGEPAEAALAAGGTSGPDAAASLQQPEAAAEEGGSAAQPPEAAVSSLSDFDAEAPAPAAASQAPDACSPDGECAAEPAAVAGSSEAAAAPEQDSKPPAQAPAAAAATPDSGEDASDEELPELLTDTATDLPEAAWRGAGGRAEAASPTMRQEDTELGIFRPDEL